MNLDFHFANRDVFIGCCESQDGSGQWSSNVSLHHSHVEGLLVQAQTPGYHLQSIWFSRAAF